MIQLVRAAAIALVLCLFTPVSLAQAVEPYGGSDTVFLLEGCNVWLLTDGREGRVGLMVMEQNAFEDLSAVVAENGRGWLKVGGWWFEISIPRHSSTMFAKDTVGQNFKVIGADEVDQNDLIFCGRASGQNGTL